MANGFWDEVQWRGLVQDFKPGTEKIFNDKMVTAYIGFDPTAPSLTIGNFMQVMLLKILQSKGHRPIVLIGGATGRIGDPSGKSDERKLLDIEVMHANMKNVEKQVRKLLNFEEGENKAIYLDNYDFYKDWNILDFIRDVGKHITVNYMMSKDSVKTRLATGLSFTEFTYQLIQGYDFKHLADHHDCVLQMGGSDQWGNITTGTELVRRTSDKEVFAFTTPLLTKPDGTKYGKSEGGNIWLDPEMTSPYKFYQFWLNSSDEMMGPLLRRFSMSTKEEIEALEAEHAAAPEKRLAQQFLAKELTCFVHSPADYDSVKKVSEMLFNKKMSKARLFEFANQDFIAISKEIPAFKVDMSKEIKLVEMLNETQICASLSEARRAIKNNAVSINKEKIKDTEYIIQSNDLINDRFLFLENGKKNKILIEA